MSYPGGKGASGVVQTIINQQPPHDLYIEPFLGGGAVMRAKRPARVNIGMDLDPDPLARFDDGRSQVYWPGSQFEFRSLDSINWLEVYGPSLETTALIYCDPPYPLGSRRRNRALYRCEMTDQGHADLLTTLRRLRCMVQISSYWNSLYASMLEDWRLIRFPSMTRGGVMEECLWMNYPAPAALHDYRHLGGDFRQRERIKRKTQRWTSRIAKLPELERLALHSAIASTIAENSAAGSRSAGIAGAGDACRPKSALPTMLPAVSPEIAMAAIASGDRTTPGMVMLQEPAAASPGQIGAAL